MKIRTIAAVLRRAGRPDLAKVVTAMDLNPRPPKAMVEVAKKFILNRTRRLSDEDEIDQAVDQALDEWNYWVGRAFNEALADLKLIERMVASTPSS